MATLSTTARDAACNAITALLNTGTIQFQTSGSVAVATCTMSTGAFATSVTGIATANTITADTNATGGTFVKAIIRSSSAVAHITCTAGVAGTNEFNMSAAAVTAGDTVQVSGLTLTVPAS